MSNSPDFPDQKVIMVSTGTQPLKKLLIKDMNSSDGIEVAEEYIRTRESLRRSRDVKDFNGHSTGTVEVSGINKQHVVNMQLYDPNSNIDAIVTKNKPIQRIKSHVQAQL